MQNSNTPHQNKKSPMTAEGSKRAREIQNENDKIVEKTKYLQSPKD